MCIHFNGEVQAPGCFAVGGAATCFGAVPGNKQHFSWPGHFARAWLLQISLKANGCVICFQLPMPYRCQMVGRVTR